MAMHRTPEELKPLIMQATRHLVAVGGMENFSYPKLTAEAGLSAPTVYEHYKNKDELLTSCFMEIDTEVADMMAQMLLGMPSQIRDLQSFDNLCWLLWLPYWNYLMADAERTYFYWAFYNSPYHTPELLAQRNKNFQPFLAFMQAVDTEFSVSSQCNVHMLVANLIDGTVAAAVKILRGEYPNDKRSVTTVYHMVFQPLFALLGIQSDNAKSLHDPCLS